MSNKQEIINLLEQISDLQEFLGENPFKIKAYRNGAEAIRKNTEDFEELLSQKKIDCIKGIGKGLQSIIYEYSETGSSKFLEELQIKVPDGIEELLKVRGLGPKKILMLYEQLQINSIESLEEACKSGKLAEIKGFGPSAVKKIMNEIEKLRSNRNFIHLDRALEFGTVLLKKLKSLPFTLKAEYTGELRRIREVISSIDFIVLLKNKENLSPLLEIFNNSDDIDIKEDCLVIKELYVVPVKIYYAFNENDYALKLFYTTGSSDFLENLDIRKLNNPNSEEEIFHKLNLSYVIPEMREEEFFSLPVELQKPSTLVRDDFKGFVHFHTNYSDGLHSLDEMIQFCKEENYKWAIVCDHSKSAYYAGGLKEEIVIKQRKEVDSLKKSSKFNILHGIESDILADGSLDYDYEILKEFDFIVASIHSQMQMSEEDMSRRLIKAVENPYTNLIGHPTARLILAREPVNLNITKFIDACAANNVALEINSSPRRLDLDWRYIYYAREKGCKFAINTDAHIHAEFNFMKYGISMARKGGINKEEVLNCFELDEFLKTIKK